MSFQNKVALVTGAASGMGLAAAEAFAKQTATKQLTDAGHRAIGIQCDVSNMEQVANMVAKTVSEFGRLDAAFNNAGVQSPVSNTADADPKDYDFVVGINLRGVRSCMKYELLQMRRQGSGAIVINTSLGGLVGIAQRGIYHASKHGVVGLTKSVGLECAPNGIRVNAVCPGIIETPMVTGILETQADAMDKLMETVPMNRLAR